MPKLWIEQKNSFRKPASNISEEAVKEDSHGVTLEEGLGEGARFC